VRYFVIFNCNACVNPNLIASLVYIMKHRFLLIVFLALSLVIRAQEADEFSIPDQYIVQLKGGIDGAKFFVPYPDMSIKKCLSKNMNIWLIQSATNDLLSILKSNPSVKVAQYNHSGVVRRASLIPNDSLFNMQWNMLNTAHPGADISATEAWYLNHSPLSQMGDTIVIAVIDGDGGDSSSSGPAFTDAGFDTHHPDINFFINHHEIPNNGIDDDGNGYIDDYNGWNVFTNTDSVYDPSSNSAHATHVSGIAGAIGNNNIGVAGVGWGAKIMPVVGASNLESDVVSAYDYVLEMRKLYNRTSGAKGAFIVSTNSSFGVGNWGALPSNYPIWCAMYDSLGAYGILSSVSPPDAGVNVDQVSDVPSACPSRWMISVTNTQSNDAINPQAGYGINTIHIGAPGTNIVSCYPGASYGELSGTSMSSPHLAGAVAALIANACPDLLQAYFAYPDSISLTLLGYIYGSVDPLNSLHNITTTGGRLNLYHAMLAENSYNCNNCKYNVSLTQQPLSCYGDSSATITVSSGRNSSPYHYRWTSGETTSSLTGLSAGYYQVTITDALGCHRQLSTLIYQPQPIVVSGITVIPISTGNPGNIIVNATAGNDTLTYAMDTGSYGTGHIFVTDSPGVHTIYIRNQTGCVYEATVGIYYTGIPVNNEISSLSLAPNPISTMGTLTISSATDMTAGLMISDLAGRLITSDDIRIRNGIQQKQIDMSALSDGVYILTLSHGSETLASIKVLVIK
jgi:hypothetical protein